MIIDARVDFIDACDLLKSRLARMLAIVSTAQQKALIHPDLQTHQEHIAGEFIDDILRSRNDITHACVLLKESGGQE